MGILLPILMDAYELKELEKKIARLKEEKEHAEKLRALKLLEAHYGISARLSEIKAKHPLLTLPAVQAKNAITHFAFPHFSEETKRKFGEMAKTLHNHMQRVASNKAFAERLREGQTALNPATGDLITKNKEYGKGYVATKRVMVSV